MSVPVLERVIRWVCPNCPQTAITKRADVHTEFHHCRGLRGIWVPFVEHGVRAKVVATDREDYVGGELVQTDADGRPLAYVNIVNDESESSVIYAPTATLDMRA